MPDGRTHAWVTAGLAVVTPLAVWGMGWGWQPAAGVGLGVASGLLLTPDLDVDGGCFAFTVMRRLAGRPAAFLWRAVWYPYAKLVRHRSRLSHGPLGTLLRVAYLGVPLGLLSWALGWGGPPAGWAGWAGWGLIGLSLSDLAHVGLDWVTDRRG